MGPLRLEELFDTSLLPVVRELIPRLDTPLDRDVKDTVARKLDRAADRLTAIAG